MYLYKKKIGFHLQKRTNNKLNYRTDGVIENIVTVDLK